MENEQGGAAMGVLLSLSRGRGRGPGREPEMARNPARVEMVVCATCKAPNRSQRDACFNCGTDLRMAWNVSGRLDLYRPAVARRAAR